MTVHPVELDALLKRNALIHQVIVGKEDMQQVLKHIVQCTTASEES